MPLSVGHSIVATVEPYEHQVSRRSATRSRVARHLQQGLGDGAAIGCDEGHRAGACAGGPQVAAERTVGVGDAENDQAFLRMCGLAVAVDNALPAVKAMADVVTTGARGAGVRELIAGLLAGEVRYRRQQTLTTNRVCRLERRSARKPLCGAGFGSRRPLLAIARRRRGHQRVDQPPRD